MQSKQLMYVDHLSYSYNHIIQFLPPVYAISQNCENVTTVMSIFRNDLEENVQWNLQSDHKTHVAST